MLIRSEIDPKYVELELHVCKDAMDEEVARTLGDLHALFDESIRAVDERGNQLLLPLVGIYSFFAEGQRVYALDEKQKYVVSAKLYELEEKYEESFVRISKSELVNVKKIKSLDLSLTGTIKVIMKNGYETYSSRRNVAKIRERLALKKTTRG
ncbi:MAG: LytTR family transcriptional regulator DNA-binding domain-containing protein [Lachnospiraceae bacterium]|jgi:DNA-binding LytR/AlgR family response regulator|nr:LytTR family transcriptional regulator DNA-binding domain-containing protein [Lachnospiraceae bacterium]MBP5668752.1 LytTR family transcriptional regulator DNA-binding domain-containing protein [Lachnospiraceae bacterium]MBR3469243.1 LytTR family transcriptional regulator DNA-binding domain-containing protein [Lachnospiraceae bacterium]